MKKFSLILTVLALVLGMTQCRKPIVEPTTPIVNNGEKQHITFGTGNDGSKVNVNSLSSLTWVTGDVLYVYNQDAEGVAGEYLGFITLKGEGGSPYGQFEGDINVGSREKMVFYYYGPSVISGGGNQNTAPTINANFTNQTDDDWAGFKGIQDHLIMSCKLDVNPEGDYSGRLTPCFAVLPIEITGGEANITVTDVPGNVITVNGSGILSYGSTSKDALSIIYANANQKVAMAAPATRSFIDTKVEFQYGLNPADKFDMTMDEVTVVQGSIIAAQKITVQLKSGGSIIHPTTEGTVISFNNETGLVTVKTPADLSDEMPYPKQYVAKVVETGVKYETLKAAFDAVYTTENNYGAGKTVELLCDVDMTDGQGSIAGGTKTAADWTPVGNNTNPYAGSFNGNGFTISNMTINYSGTSSGNEGGVGLFGMIKGTTAFGGCSAAWDGNSLVASAVAESNFSVRIKNVVFNNAQTANTTQKNTGAMVGYAQNAYVSDVTVKNSIVDGYKVVAGVVGGANGSVLNNLKTESTVTVQATKGYHIGGIVGWLWGSSAVLNCENNASLGNTDSSGGYSGGVVSAFSGSPSMVYNCINETALNLNNASNGGGIVGNAQTGGVIANCTNIGKITGTTTTAADSGIGGITTYTGGLTLSNCHNSGDIDVNTSYLGGVVGYALSNNGQTYGSGMTLTGDVTNSGNLTNGKQGGKTSNIAYSQIATTYKNVAFDDVVDLNANMVSHSKAVTLESTVTVANTTGTLVIPSIEGNGSFTSANVVATAVSTENLIGSATVTLDVPNVSMTISGNRNGLNLILEGVNQNVTVNSDANLSSLSVGSRYTPEKDYGTGTVTVNGNLPGGLSYLQGGSLTIGNGVTVGGLVIGGGNKNVVIDNYGTISCTIPNSAASTQTIFNVSTKNYITFNNRPTGLVILNDNGLNTSGYCYLLEDFGSKSLTLNLYNGSKLNLNKTGGSDKVNWFAIGCGIDEDSTTNVNYEDESAFYSGSTQCSCPISSGTSSPNQYGKVRTTTVTKGSISRK